MVHKTESTHGARRGPSPKERTQGEEKAAQTGSRQRPVSEMEAKAVGQKEPGTRSLPATPYVFLWTCTELSSLLPENIASDGC